MRSIVICLCVCKHSSGTAGSIRTKFFVQIPCGRGSILLWRRCATSCTSGFMDDVTFGRSGHMSVVKHSAACGVVWPGQSLMSECLVCVCRLAVLRHLWPYFYSVAVTLPFVCHMFCAMFTCLMQMTVMLLNVPATRRARKQLHDVSLKLLLIIGDFQSVAFHFFAMVLVLGLH